MKTLSFQLHLIDFGIGYGFSFNFLFKFLKSVRKLTQFYLGLGCANYGAPHYESLSPPSNTSRIKLSTYFLNISSCTFDTGYVRDYTAFTSSLNSKYTGSVFQLPSFPLKNSSNICNNFGNLLHCVIVKC